MQAWLRRGVAGALLLCLLVFLIAYSRLDEGVISREVIAQLEQASGMNVRGQRIRLSMQHGLSLRVSQLRVDGKGGGWSLAADIARFDIAYIPLLFGKVRISSIDLVQPVLNLQHTIPPEQLFGPALVAGVMRDAGGLSLRQGSIMLHHVLLADQLEGSLRRVMSGDQTNWEVQCRYAGGDFSSQGYFRNDHEGRENVFGRISATQLRLSRLPGMLISPSHYDLLDASLTFSRDADGQWLWFGNMLSHDEHGVLPDLSWRGKIGGKSLQDFSLQDAFANFGKSTRVVLDGGCESGHECRFGINTNKADVGLLLKAAFGKAPLSGSMDASLTVQQAGAGWRIDGKVGLRNAKWAEARLPDSVTDISDGRVDSMHRLELDHADIRPDGSKGMLEVNHLQFDSGRLDMELLFDRLRDVWVPLGNLWLSHSPLPPGLVKNGHAPTLAGSGELDGSIHWQGDASGSLMHFSLDAAKAKLGFGSFFAKPMGLKASVQGSYSRGESGTRLQMSGLQLGSSRLGSLQARLDGSKARFSFSGASLDLDALKKAGMTLPAGVGEWHGSLAGGLDHVATRVASLQQAVSAAEGSLKLTGFGHGGQSWSGEVQLHGGQLHAPHMRWQQGDRFAEFSASTDIAELRGQLDVDHASLNWQSADGLPSWLRQAELRGRFAHVDMQWDANAWKDMRGEYAMQGGGLSLLHVEGHLAGGGVRSQGMHIESMPGGLRFAGRVGMTAVSLGHLQGLADALGVQPAGYLFFNARLAGTLPAGLKDTQGKSVLSGNGDVEIRRGRFAHPSDGSALHWQDAAASTLAGDVGNGFDSFATRFRIRDGALHLNRIHLSRGGLSVSGDASVAASGVVAGKLAVQRGKQTAETALAGSWPAWTGLASGH